MIKSLQIKSRKKTAVLELDLNTAEIMLRAYEKMQKDAAQDYRNEGKPEIAKIFDRIEKEIAEHRYTVFTAQK